MRRALAIQLIINKEFGPRARTRTRLQGSFIIEELTDLVEEAVLTEFRAHLRARRRARRDGAHVPALQDPGRVAATTRRSSTTARCPIIGVNTFLDPEGSPTVTPPEVIRATTEEKEYAIAARDAF